MAIQNGGSDDDTTLTGDDRILHRARKRYRRCMEFYGDAYKNSLEDEKFANQDDRNHYGWPEEVYSARTAPGKNKPCLTINIVEPHNRLVINEAMKNKMSIRVRATGGEASADAGEGMQSLIERTENISTATIAYRSMIGHQINGGIGWLNLQTAFIRKSFDQDVYIREPEDPRAVFKDPDVEEPDGSDAEYGFVFDKMSRDKFNREHPKFKNKVGLYSSIGEDIVWLTDKHVLVATYYERSSKNDELIHYTLPDGSEFTGHRSEMEKNSSKELVDGVIAQIDSGEIEGRYRDDMTYDVNWYLIGGDCIIKKGDKPSTRWIGQYVPLIPCYGRKSIIEGKFDCKGLTRSQISPQQMLNYNASGSVQFGALQSKTPYIGPLAAFENNDEQWANLNNEEYAFIGYTDSVSEEGEEPREVSAPKRQDPPQTAPVYMQGMQDAERWAMMVTGQYQSKMGEEDQQAAASGKAINARNRQGDVATQDFAEGQADTFRLLGKMLIEIYPKLYDTKRVLHIEGGDLTKRAITIDPDAAEAFKKLKKETETAEEIVFNPNVGEYEVVSDPGPNYATKREQSWDAGVQILSQNEALTDVVGDLVIRNGDFEGAQEMGERLKANIKHDKPWLFDDGQNPAMAAIQAQLMEGQKLNAELMTKLSDMQLKLRGRDEKRDVDAFRAETDRMKEMRETIESGMLTPAEKAKMQHELMIQGNEHIYSMIQQSNAANVDAEDGQEGNNEGFHPTMAGARQAPDGLHYIDDPERKGKFIRVDHVAARPAFHPTMIGAKPAADGKHYLKAPGGGYIHVGF